MSKDNYNDRKLKLLVEGIELSNTAYESAKRRYEDLGDWFKRDDCALRDNDPHVFPQGSFALGTAIRPRNGDEEYDLDLGCKLRRGILRSTHSPRELADLVGRELRAYRHYRHIESPLEPKNRCWRLNYKDDLPFHMDIVQMIPMEPEQQESMRILMERELDAGLAFEIAANAVCITDRRHPGFDYIQDDWLSSNPEGYVRWFVSRMTETGSILRSEAQVDGLPIYARRTSLQRAVQLLKSHRDAMFEEAPDSKPISIILTTIAAHAYQAGQSFSEAMATILNKFEGFRQSNSNEVLNPVNPNENFADRWAHPGCQHLKLKETFHRWIVQVRADFAEILERNDPRELRTSAETRFKVRLDEGVIAKALGMTSTPVIVSAASRHVSIKSPPKPWAI